MNGCFVADKARRMMCELFADGELYGKKILIGLSGGADSTALVNIMCDLSHEMGFSVCACHINHMIRGDEANRDEEFAKVLCQKLDIPFYCGRYNVPHIAKSSGKGLEEAARDVRYSFFQKLCDEGKAELIATAHTASDNAETLLFNISRGCGLSGLCGIPKRRGNIIRPLINVTRREIEEYLSDIGQSYVTDSTNLVDDCSRNIIRHRVIPPLCGINSAFCRKTSELSEIASRENEFLEKLAQRYRTDDIAELAKLDRVILSRIVGGIYRDITGNMPGMDHTETLCDEIQKAARTNCGERKEFHLPCSVRAVFECGKLMMMPDDKRKNSDLQEYDICPVKGINVLCCGKILAVLGENTEDYEKFGSTLEYDKNIYSLFMESKLFSDIIKGKIRLRSGLAGDKIRISGMSRDIRKLYSAKKIPVGMRKFLPRIVDDGTGEIIALPYTGVCDSQHEHSGMADISVKLYILCNKE